jgi:hypothetical protein
LRIISIELKLKSVTFISYKDKINLPFLFDGSFL